MEEFEKWLKRHDVYLHRGLRICVRDGRRSVFADRAIPRGTIVLRVPKDCILSRCSSPLANLFADWGGTLDAQVALTLSFLYECHVGEASPWTAYIRLFPETIDSPKLWSSEASASLSCTEVGTVGGTDVRDWQRQFDRQVVPFLAYVQLRVPSLTEFRVNFPEFCRAIAVVGSRAFEIDAFHGLALVPFADMLDHELLETVHFETDYEVCEECGARAGDCGHTIDDDELTSNLGEDTCDLRVCRPLAKGQEVFNTYGELGNDVLLPKFGFALEGNIWDRVHLRTSKGADALPHEDHVALIRPQVAAWLALDGLPVASLEDACFFRYDGTPSNAMLLCAFRFSTSTTESFHAQQLLNLWRLVLLSATSIHQPIQPQNILDPYSESDLKFIQGRPPLRPIRPLPRSSLLLAASLEADQLDSALDKIRAGCIVLSGWAGALDERRASARISAEHPLCKIIHAGEHALLLRAVELLGACIASCDDLRDV
ncbi:hypothetical protein PYCC9005_003301 [Savitreella phatthalungensis]